MEFDVFLYLLAFTVFVNIQAIFINGVHISFSKEMIFGTIKTWLESKINAKWILKPTIGCVRCMASVWGTLTFWPIVIFLFGFHVEQLFIFVVDVFVLVYLNFIYYKKA